MAGEPDRGVAVKEGDWILIASHGWHDSALGVGLVARGPGHSSNAVLLYVFGPFAERPPETTLATLRPDDNLMVCLMHAGPIAEGRLPIIWHDAEFSRDRWSVPWFSVSSEIPGAHIDAVRTSDDDPFDVVETRPVSLQDARALPEYAAISYSAILEKLENPDLPLPRLSDRF
jgi:hypothetical protein